MMQFKWGAMALMVAVVVTGCLSDYHWRPSFPESKRTVSVPVFKNESEVAELGAIAARQVLREFQREGTLKIRPTGEAALEVQGTVKGSGSRSTGYSRTTSLRYVSYDFEANFEVSVIDKSTGRVLINNRTYEARVTYAAGNDLMTAERDASGRLADDLARQVVDDVLNLKW